MAVASYTFMSEVLGEQTRLVLILPTFEPWGNQKGGKSFYESYGKKKVLYVLHGGSDDSTMYLRRTRLEEYVTERELIAVCPEVRLSFYCNMVHGRRYFDYLSQELPEVIGHLLPVSGRREDHFVIGNSMGARGAFQWALNAPDYFAAAAGMSGAADLEDLGFYTFSDPERPPMRSIRNTVCPDGYNATDGSRPPLGRIRDTVCPDGPGRLDERIFNAFGTKEDYRGSANDLRHRMGCLVRGRAGEELPKLYSCCGRSDPFYQGSRAFSSYGQELGYPIFFEEGEGGHTWDFWDRWLPAMLDRMLNGEGE